MLRESLRGVGWPSGPTPFSFSLFPSLGLGDSGKETVPVCWLSGSATDLQSTQAAGQAAGGSSGQLPA